jgi:adenylosuccinate synthase
MAKGTGHVLALVGGQFGSEGKGVIVAYIADRYNVHVRTGGTNAGHTFMHQGVKRVMQTVPCGWVNPNAILVIGRGGLIEMDILKREVNEILEIDPYFTHRLIVDSRCGVISQWHMDEEGGVQGELHQRIGSTGKGVGAARRDRLMRDPLKFLTVAEYIKQEGDVEFSDGSKLSQCLHDDTPRYLQQQRNLGQDILLEGTQGSGLDLIHGQWPYVTSNGTNAAQMAADAGIPPQHVDQVMLVCRTYPIRVAGNSGDLKDEVTWDQLSELIGETVVEKTTVTKKVRRVGRWDEDLVDQSVLLNAPTSIAITFMDYISPQDRGKTLEHELSQTARAFIDYVEARFGTPVSLVGTGGEGFQVVETGEDL